MSLDKFPRWALIAVCGLFMSATLFFANRAVAEGDKTKAVAYEALKGVEQLQTQIADVRSAQTLFQRDYREDTIRQENNARAMEDRIIRALNKA